MSRNKNQKTRTIEIGPHDTAIVLTAEDHGFLIVASEHASQVARLGYRLAQAMVQIACSDLAFKVALAVLRGDVMIAGGLGVVGDEDEDECDGDCENCPSGIHADAGNVDPANLPN